MRFRRIPAAFRVAHGIVVVATLDGRSSDLTGAAAAVWLAADDDGCDAAELIARLHGTGLSVDDIDEATRQLTSARLVEAVVA